MDLRDVDLEWFGSKDKAIGTLLRLGSSRERTTNNYIWRKINKSGEFCNQWVWQGTCSNRHKRDRLQEIKNNNENSPLLDLVKFPSRDTCGGLEKGIESHGGQGLYVEDWRWFSLFSFSSSTWVLMFFLPYFIFSMTMID